MKKILFFLEGEIRAAAESQNRDATAGFREDHSTSDPSTLQRL